MSGAVFSPGGFTPTQIAGFWLAADDYSSTPTQLTDKQLGAIFTPIGSAGGAYESAGWNGGQKSISADGQGWQTTNASVAAMFTGGQNFWLCMVGMMLSTSSSPHVMPDQTLFSAGLSSDATKYMALKELKSIGSQQWVQRFGAGAETQDSSAQLQGPFPYIWLIQVDNSGVHTLTRDGLSEQTFTRNTSGSLGVDTVVIGGLIQGGTITASGRWRWRHIMGNSGNLSGANVTNLLTWINGNTQGFSQKKGIVGSLYTKTHVLLGGPQQSNGQGQGSPATAVTASRAFMLGFNSFIKTLGDPSASATGTPFTGVFLNSGIGSAYPAWANQMHTNGKQGSTEALFLVPSGVGGSSMGSFWVTGASTSPPDWSAPLGAVCLRLSEVMRNLPNPVIGLCDWYQGESETLSSSQAANWGASNRAQLCRTTLNNFITAQGYTLGTNFKHVVTILPPTNWASATPADWLTERNSQSTFGGMFSDTTTYQMDDGPWTDSTNLHVQIGPQNDKGVALAGLW